jgi:phosphoribosyl 1,2-cyclic phosphate phosphodiesterase
VKLNIIGSGGVVPIPRPCCQCELCKKARAKGLGEYQTGPSMFVYDDNILFDTPEEIRLSLIKSDIEKVENVILTHWHPDHTQGIRVLEQINYDYENKKPIHEPINLYIAAHQLETFKKLSCGGFLDLYQSKGIIKINFFEHGKPIVFDHITITPYSIEKTKGYYFLLEDQKGSKVIYASCEYHELKVYDEIRDIDVLISHGLYFETDHIGRGFKSNTEDSFEKMLEDSKIMNAKKIVVTHNEELFGLFAEEADLEVQKYFADFDIKFAKDGQMIEL